MSRLKDDVLGYYIPSFFEMHVDTNSDDLTITKLPLEDRTVLFHEYIHFLQDFTTYYGINSIYVYSEYLHSVVNRIYSIQSPQFQIPFVINDNKDNVLLNQQVSSLTQGDSEESNYYVISSIDEDSDKLEPNDSMDEIPNVILNKNGEIRVFGAIAIMESMAYLMERLCSPSGYVSSPDYPYRAAELVADYYVNGFSGNPLMVLALCDMSLQSSNPGTTFVGVLKEIQNGSISFNSPEEIYDYFYGFTATGIKGQTAGWISHFKSLLYIVKDCMKSYLRGMPICNDYYRWIDALVSFSIDWRENDPYFLLKMARHQDLATNNCWGYAVSRVGSPIMTNNNGHYFKLPYQNSTSGGMDVEYFKAFQQMMRLFESGESSCEMYEWCAGSPGISPNALCLSSPWKRCTDKSLCPYALVWYHWGLASKEPQI